MSVAESIKQHHDGSAEHGDGSVGDMDMFGGDETGDDCEQDKQRLLQQSPIGYGVYGFDFHNFSLIAEAGFQLASVNKVKGQNQNQHGNGDNRRQFIDKVHERQIECRADENVRRIADERGCSADVGGKDFHNQVRIGIDLKFFGDLESYRHNQQNGGNVVQQGGKNGGNQPQREQQAAGIGAGAVYGPDGYILKHARFFGNADYYHHSCQQGKGVKVDAGNGGFLRQNAGKNHNAGADQRNNGAIELFGK